VYSCPKGVSIPSHPKSIELFAADRSYEPLLYHAARLAEREDFKTSHYYTASIASSKLKLARPCGLITYVDGAESARQGAEYLRRVYPVLGLISVARHLEVPQAVLTSLEVPETLNLGESDVIIPINAFGDDYESINMPLLGWLKSIS